MAVFTITADQVPQAVSLGGTDELRARQGEREGRVVPKLSVDGRPTFASGVVVARETGGQEKGVTIAVIETPTKPWSLGQALRAEGKCWVTPYVTDTNRQGLSFVVERLVPVDASTTPVASGSKSTVTS